MEFGRGLKVPLLADYVLSPEVRYDVIASEGRPMTSIVFPLEDDYETGFMGRVTFEGLDSIRCSRGEYAPYETEQSQSTRSEFPWVFEVEDSEWLRQRHSYENGHYKTPLLDEYNHYLFRFHDEFVEAIARGICFEKLEKHTINDPPGFNHPSKDLPDNLPSDDFVVEGISCQVRHNPLALEDLIERSRLCSQILFQYSITLDGQTQPSYAAMLRTIRGNTLTRLRRTFFRDSDLMTVNGVGEEPKFRKAFELCVIELAARRRQMGKPV